MLKLATLTLVLGVAFSASTWAADDVKLVPSSVSYKITMISAQNSQVQDVEGGMVDTSAITCDGYKVSQQMILRIIPRQGGRAAVINSAGTMLEGLDGLSFRYSQKTTVNGRLTESTSGAAALTGVGQGGQARIAGKPEPVELPAGTLFPVAMTNRVLQAAAAGQTRVETRLFDGTTSTPNGLSAIIATLTKPQDLTVPADKVGLAVGSQVWPVATAYYAEDGSAAPYMENRIILMPNGSAETMYMDIDGIKLRLDLAEYKKLPVPECPAVGRH